MRLWGPDLALKNPFSFAAFSSSYLKENLICSTTAIIHLPTYINKPKKKRAKRNIHDRSNNENTLKSESETSSFKNL